MRTSAEDSVQVPSEDGRVAYRINEFCARVGMGRAWAYRLMQAGRLPFIRVGHRRMITAATERAVLAGELAAAPSERRRYSGRLGANRQGSQQAARD